MLRQRTTTVCLIIPPDFTRTLLALQSGDRSQPVQITFGGDLTNPYYTVASVMAISALESYVQQVSGQLPLINYTEHTLGTSAARTEFEIYVPGILVFAIIMLIFLAAMTAARRVRDRHPAPFAAYRDQCLRIPGWDEHRLAAGRAGSLVFAFGAALLCGFHSAGPLWLAVLIGALTSLGVIGAGLVVAAFSRNVSQAFVIANFPLGLFMFFSGSVYSLPRIDLFTIGDQPIGLYDLLAPTHAVSALNKVFVLGAGLGEVTYELISMLLLSALYFALGVWFFQRRKLGAVRLIAGLSVPVELVWGGLGVELILLPALRVGEVYASMRCRSASLRIMCS